MLAIGVIKHPKCRNNDLLDGLFQLTKEISVFPKDQEQYLLKSHISSVMYNKKLNITYLDTNGCFFDPVKDEDLISKFLSGLPEMTPFSKTTKPSELKINPLNAPTNLIIAVPARDLLKYENI